MTENEDQGRIDPPEPDPWECEFCDGCGHVKGVRCPVCNGTGRLSE